MARPLLYGVVRNSRIRCVNCKGQVIRTSSCNELEWKWDQKLIASGFVRAQYNCIWNTSGFDRVCWASGMSLRNRFEKCCGRGTSTTEKATAGMNGVPWFIGL